MTLTIDGNPIPLRHRVAAMIAVLVEQQGEIEALSSGQIEFHYSQFQIKYYPPREVVQKKLDGLNNSCVK